MVIVSCASVRTNNRGTPRPSVSPAIRLCTLATPGRHIGKRRAKRNTPPQWECAAENSRPIELYSNQSPPKARGGDRRRSQRRCLPFWLALTGHTPVSKAAEADVLSGRSRWLKRPRPMSEAAEADVEAAEADV